MPSKPLRFLYSKYAGHAPITENGSDDPELGGISVNNKQSTETSVTQGRQLHRLGREFTKTERVNMFFAMSQNNYEGESQDYSSVGSASTNGRSCNSRRDRTLNVSPVRFRSKSQEFQSKYKLAVSRYSPEHKFAPLPQTDEVLEDSDVNDNNANSHDNSLGDRLPLISSKSKIVDLGEKEGKVMEITMQTKNSCRKSVLPTRGQASHFNLIPTNINKNININVKRPGSSNSCDSFQSVQIRHQNKDLHKDTNNNNNDNKNNRNRLLVDKHPRCQSRSPADDDRLDSRHYQHLLNDFSSTSVSSFSSVKSDPASSQFSARAHRPSTTRTSSTNHRLRDIWASSLDSDRLPGTSTKTKSRHNSVNNKSPETQWPPRYSIIPSWPSYEDIQTLNSCGDHHNIITQLYRRENRWSKDRNSTLIYRNNHLTMKYPHVQQQIHVVPSHTSMECAMCNLYSQRPDPTACPPNSPMVNQHDLSHHNHHNPESRLSNDYSTYVNHSTPTNNTAPSSALSKQHTSTTPALSREPSKLATFRKNSQYSLGDSNSSIPSRSVTASLPGKDKTNGMPPAPNPKRVSFSGKSKVDKMSFTWDTCKVAYIQANV